MPASSPSSNSDRVLHLPWRLLAITGSAFATGLLLFSVVWLFGRKDEDFHQAQTAQVAQETAPIKPLPEPLPASNGASEMPQAKPSPPQETPKLVETAPTPPPVRTSSAGTTGAEASVHSPVARASATSDRPVPIEGQMPPPRYPAEALRRGEAGTVLVHVDVDNSGMPTGVTLIKRSGSRDLDRAAMESVRRWRFRPAQQNGRPVPASIDIPIDFKPGP
ncbi:energy transducer TonB [Xanthomonas albilineans]|uniref:Putative tonb_protein n=1 Tax=Xanthomonas albilineans (strain GPE PC73 / CFBP 7063) TaxID=380358 RepID=D2UE46_XANAP|nr:energy transducer TonB [Xanthomonas albilineans]QHQ28432.1 energry transducer TonB [Xanthomonas albilineans]CBA16197.1 putative tonb_protein [Xanthomonas albilineans GPE PC73]